MRFLFFILILFYSRSVILAQVVQPVTWTYSIQSLGNNEYNIVCAASIEKNWWTYSQFIKEGGPIPTHVSINTSNDIELIGTCSEYGEHMKEGHEPLFDMVLKKYADKVVFTQKIKVKPGVKEIGGSVEFMCCDDSQCLPPEVLTFNLLIP